MNNTLLLIKEEIVNYIQQTEEKKLDAYQTSEYIIQYIIKKHHTVKQQFENKPFNSISEEIYYFKHIKCHLLSLIQYHLNIQKIEFERINTNPPKIIKYYQAALKQTQKKIKPHYDYYKYYKSKLTHLDSHYFRQFTQDIHITSGEFLHDIEHRSICPMLHLFVQIEAWEMLRIYLKNKSKELKVIAQHETVTSKKSVKWTTSKTDLIELVYALHAAGVFNNGKAELKEVALYLQQVFQTDLGQYNRVFYDIRSRKNNKTKCLDNLREALIKRMKDTDNELFA